ncbi:MAG: hypothetical protein J2P45_31635 [Candidatus Dormibacteraeota bacterium]|nr:hypothetical protein [Candidatus Dormibacteraeota bacterium]
MDTLHLSARGTVRGELWEELERSKRRAHGADEEVRFDFPETSGSFLLRPYGWRGYAYWLSSPDLELMLGRSERFPAAVVQLHAAYLHSVGVDWALEFVELLLRHDVFSGPYELLVSRLDLYADLQGWAPVLEDLHRFIGYGRNRRAFGERHESFIRGHRLTGLMFGRDALVARLYDKTLEIRQRGVSWLPDLWGPGSDGEPIWRLEFQYRREALVEFNLRGVPETLASLQDLWRYATSDWLSLRTPTPNRQRTRWPLDSVWEEVQAVEIVPSSTGAVRRRLQQASLQRIVLGLWGYLTALGALRQRPDLEASIAELRRQLERHMEERDRSFPAEVARKRARYLGVTAFLNEEPEDDCGAA